MLKLSFAGRLCAALLPALLAPAGAPAAQVALAPYASGLAAPIDLQDAPGQADRVYVAERAGRVRVLDRQSGATVAAAFLDVTGRVNTSGEGGLLGLAFHPGYAQNGYVFVNYTTGTSPGAATNPFRVRVSRFTRDPADALRVLPASEVVMLEVNKPFDNHNGGAIAFGPDGHLYVTQGDGGSGGDPQENGQNLGTLLGSILRLDVDGGGTPLDCGAGTGAARVPAGNPFVGRAGACDEIFAYGFRNPWRIAFDRTTGRLWAGDVGQGAWEEVDVVEAGLNYGWNTMEGAHCFDPPSGCDRTGLVLPVWEYGRSQGLSITGGYVYRGAGAPSLVGRYVYGDFGSGRVWALTDNGPNPATNAMVAQVPGFQLVSFGEDAAGELYALLITSGEIRRFVETGATTEGSPGAGSLALTLVGPNPVRGRATLRATAAAAGPARLAVYDALGREVAVAFAGALAAGEAREVALDTDTLPPGVYVVRLDTATGARSVKLVVAR